MSKKPYKHCGNAQSVLPELDNECCGSCHSDDDEGYGHLCNLDSEHFEWEVCCSMATALEKDDVLKRVETEILKRESHE